MDSVDLRGTDEVSAGDVQRKIATTKSPKFLMLFPGVVYDYSIFNRQVLEKDLQRIERYYRAKGYYEAKVRAARIEYVEKDHVEVTIEVEEGEPVKVGKVVVRGLDALPEEVAQEARLEAEALELGEPFDEEVYTTVEGAIRRALTDRGYAYAKVTRQARVDVAKRAATAWYMVIPGPESFFGDITIQSEEPYNEAPVRRALNIRKGDPYSTQLLEDARDAVIGLGVFSNVEMEPQLDDPPPHDRIVPLKVSVTPMKPRTLQLGGGIELDLIRTDVHLRARWEHRNFFGGYRHFFIDFKPGVVLYPMRVPTFQAPTDFLLEHKLRAELRQPGFIEPRTTGVLRSEFNIFPVILSPEIDPEATVLGYREVRGAAGLERRYRWFFGALYAHYQRNMPFAYVGVLDPALSGVTISFLDLLAEIDLRDPEIQPRQGLLLGMNLQTAGGISDAQDVKVQPEVRGYIPVVSEVTFALRASTGFLFPFNYGETLSENARAGRPPEGVTREEWVRDTQIVYFRGFFAGGPNSNRGYALRGVAPHGAVPFFNPDVAAEAFASECDPAAPNADSPRCQQPLGGMTLWEASAELRLPISGPVTAALFCDASDVSPEQTDLRFKYLHLSCGSGIRYDTPVGPIRLDVGYRIPGMQIIGEPDDAVDGQPGTVLGLPIAVSLGIGEAF